MRRVVLGIIVLVLPVAIHAQQSVPPTDTGANPITEAFRGFGYYGNWLLAAFDSIPADKYGFKPTPVQQSIGYIAQHLEDANLRVVRALQRAAASATARRRSGGHGQGAVAEGHAREATARVAHVLRGRGGACERRQPR